jgi:hypothetical protein
VPCGALSLTHSGPHVVRDLTVEVKTNLVGDLLIELTPGSTHQFIVPPLPRSENERNSFGESPPVCCFVAKLITALWRQSIELRLTSVSVSFHLPRYPFSSRCSAG